MKSAKLFVEDKITKRSEVIYQSSSAEEREMVEIEKMLVSDGVEGNTKLVKAKIWYCIVK